MIFTLKALSNSSGSSCSLLVLYNRGVPNEIQQELEATRENCSQLCNRQIYVQGCPALWMSYSAQGRDNRFSIHGLYKCGRRSSSLVVLGRSRGLGVLSHLGLGWAASFHFLLKQPREPPELGPAHWSRWQVLVVAASVGQCWTSDLEVKGSISPIINPQSPLWSKCWYINLSDWWKQTANITFHRGIFIYIEPVSCLKT